jgi:hypothetical protein
MERTDRIAVLAAIGLSVLAAWYPGAAVSLAQTEPAGKALFLAQKCDLCHSVAGAGIAATTKAEKLKGPDLSALVPEDPAALESYLRLQGELRGKKHKKEFKGTQAELEAILAWLKEQKAAS